MPIRSEVEVFEEHADVMKAMVARKPAPAPDGTSVMSADESSVYWQSRAAALRWVLNASENPLTPLDEPSARAEGAKSP
jgi:hypothetical protein